MTYPLIVLVVRRGDRGGRPRDRATTGVRATDGGIGDRGGGAPRALTAVFDNLMIAAGLFTYPPEHLSGLRIGLAPLEDFSYAVCAAFLVPAVYTLLATERARERA